MAKKKRAKSKKNILGSVAVVAVTLAVILLFAFDSGGEFTAALSDIWDNTTAHVTGADTNPAARSLANPDQHAGELILYAMDTGNSDSLLLYTPDGYSMLVDAGEPDDFGKISGTLASFGIEKLDAAVATHPDSDHIGSMDDVLLEYQPATFYLPDFTKNTAAYTRMLQAADQVGGDVVFAGAPLSFTLGEQVQAQVLSPSGAMPDEANNASIVLLLTFGETKILLTGDAEQAALGVLLDQYGAALDADVLKVGHHGSYTSTTEELLRAVTPEIGIITCGEGNDYGHPHSETLDLLAEHGTLTLRTDQNGDIAVFMDGTEIEYATAA
ncbi:MAG TPA: hypothetical protein DEB31_00825 [Clostridiales bacterium]|nr:hypothetical protein [Clostridiales bacterium]